MKLLTHNMLASTARGVANGFPLGIEATALETHSAEFNKEFLKHVFPKLEWGALVDACKSLALPELPQVVTDEHWDDDAFLKQLHHNLLEVHIQEGNLVCPETGRKFPVTKGVPNMLLNEDEV